MCGLSIVYENKCLIFASGNPLSKQHNAYYRNVTHRKNALTGLIGIDKYWNVNVQRCCHCKRNNKTSETRELNCSFQIQFYLEADLSIGNLELLIEKETFIEGFEIICLVKLWKMMTTMKVLFRWVDRVKIIVLAAKLQYWKIQRIRDHRHDVIDDEIEGKRICTSMSLIYWHKCSNQRKFLMRKFFFFFISNVVWKL